MYQPTYVVMTRKQFFDLVWSKPMSKLALDYGITDVGLVKICKKHKIPRPPVGYWLRKKSRRGRRPRLPRVDRELEEVWVRQKPSEAENAPFLEPDVASLLARADALQTVELRSDLRGAHPLVRRIGKPHRSGSRDDKEPRLSVAVSRPLLRRAKLLLDALLVTLAQFGIEPEVEEHRGEARQVLKIFGVAYEIFVRERHRHATAEELEELNRERIFVSKVELLPTQRLELIIEPTSWGTKRTWRDTARRSIEDVLHRVPRTLLRLAAIERAKRRERAARERRWEEERRADEEARRREARERERQRAFLEEVKAWQVVDGARSYIEAVRSAVEARPPGKDTDDATAWIAWATCVVDNLDPVRKRV